MTQKLFTRNFMLLILGQLTSLFGNFILKLALSMYVLEITGSAAIFAGILSIATIPTIILSPLGGILADRANRRNIMVALDTLTGISVLITTLLLSAKNDMVMISILLIILCVNSGKELTQGDCWLTIRSAKAQDGLWIYKLSTAHLCAY